MDTEEVALQRGTKRKNAFHLGMHHIAEGTDHPSTFSIGVAAACANAGCRKREQTSLPTIAFRDRIL